MFLPLSFFFKMLDIFEKKYANEALNQDVFEGKVQNVEITVLLQMNRKIFQK